MDKLFHWIKANIIVVVGVLLTLIWLTVLIAFCITSIDHVLESDKSAELILAKTLSDGNGILSTEWYYSTELRLLNSQLISSLLFRITDSWHLVRITTNFLLYVLLILSYLYLTQKMHVERKWRILTMHLPLVPFSFAYVNFLLIGNYYLPHTILIFMYIGLFIDITENGLKHCLATRIKLATLCIISFLAGLCGVKYILFLFIPSFLAGILSCYKCTYLPFLNCELVHDRRRLLFLVNVLLQTILGIFGYFANITFMANTYSFYDSTTISFVDFANIQLIDRFNSVIQEALSCFGYVDGIQLMTFQGMTNILVLCLLAAISVLIVYEIGRYRTQSGSYETYLALFFIFSIGANIVIYTLLDFTVSERYFLLCFVVLMPLFALYLSHTQGTILRLIYGMLVLCSINCTGAAVFRQYWKNDINVTRDGYLRYLVEDNQTFGFATYWNANVTFELTNGKVEVAPLSPDSFDSLFYWLSPKKFSR